MVVDLLDDYYTYSTYYLLCFQFRMVVDLLDDYYTYYTYYLLCLQFRMVVDLLDDYCTMRGWHFLRLTGSTNRVQRMVNLQAFT